MIKIDVGTAINQAALNNVSKALDNLPKETSKVFATEIAEKAKEDHSWTGSNGVIFKDRSGSLRDSYSIVENDDHYSIKNSSKHSEYLFYGTGIYGKHKTEVIPVKAKYLRFVLNGEIVFRRSVKGIKGFDWISGAYEKNRSEIDKKVLFAISIQKKWDMTDEIQPKR